MNTIDKIIKDFDFNRVHEVMELLNWTWYPQNKVPTISELKKTAEELLIYANTEFKKNGKFSNVETGGFIAEVMENRMRLHFSITNMDEYKNNV
jgi:hypothetical protein